MPVNQTYNHRFLTNQTTGQHFKNCLFFGTDLTQADLTKTEFTQCDFEDCPGIIPIWLGQHFCIIGPTHSKLGCAFRPNAWWREHGERFAKRRPDWLKWYVTYNGLIDAAMKLVESEKSTEPVT